VDISKIKNKEMNLKMVMQGMMNEFADRCISIIIIMRKKN